LKPWYDHIGGDAIGLTWNKHNSKVNKNLLSVLLKRNTKGKIVITNVMFDCRNENEMKKKKKKKKVIQWRC